MFYTYILKSKKDGELYIGSTNNMGRRLAEHNNGLVSSTEHRTPFVLIYCEAYFSEEDARHREHNLKLHGRARQQLFKRIKRSIASS